MRISFGAMLILGAVTLSGCASPHWIKDGASMQDFNMDAYACERDARMSAYFGGGLFAQLNFEEFEGRCMIAHGWMKQAS